MALTLFLSSEGLHSKMFRNSANLGTRLTVACLFPGSATKVTLTLNWMRISSMPWWRRTPPFITFASCTLWQRGDGMVLWHRGDGMACSRLHSRFPSPSHCASHNNGSPGSLLDLPWAVRSMGVGMSPRPKALKMGPVCRHCPQYKHKLCTGGCL